jgi:hypothetical protein
VAPAQHPPPSATLHHPFQHHTTSLQAAIP